MHHTIQHTLRAIVFLSILFATWYDGIAQDTANPYYLDGNEVVFVFDVRNYAKALHGEYADKVDFADLGIYDVAISGQFNNWSKKGWKMVQKGEFLFELRKHIEEFNDPFPLEFRYIINGNYLAEKEGDISNTRNFSNDFLKDVYKLDLSVIKLNSQGNVRFFLGGHSQAKEVILAGSFNNWDEQAICMNQTPEGWELRADVPPGRYEYKFIVDKEWKHDPLNKEIVRNEHGTLNSILWVTVPVEFILEGNANAQNVILSGSFNEWNERKLKMIRKDGVWTSTLNIAGGKHHYKFIVDGNWITDPKNPIVEDDGNGNLNSVLFVH